MEVTQVTYDFNSLTKQADEATNRDKFYTDFEDVDPNVLHQISELTEWIRTKGKGSDVREIIAQLFERTWLENIKEGNANMEVAQARGDFATLMQHLLNITANANTANQKAGKLENGKVDKNGAGQVSWSMLAQDAREQISGSKTAVVGVNAVSTANLVDKSVTNTKMQGEAVNVHFIPDPNNHITYNSDTKILSFNNAIKYYSSTIVYNGQYVDLALNSQVDLKNSITSSAGIIIIDLASVS